jgi:hypothetical protein
MSENSALVPEYYCLTKFPALYDALFKILFEVHALNFFVNNEIKINTPARGNMKLRR